MMLDKDGFLKEYRLVEAFKKSGLSWDLLMEIYSDYEEQHYCNLKKLTKQFISDLEQGQYQCFEDEYLKVKRIHTIFGRAKNPEHLIEKIIRKVGVEDSKKYSEINKENYREKITDLIGIRILVLAKEDWWAADKLIRHLFTKFQETPVSYVCYGDRKIFDESLLHVDYTNKGYRSQHYIVEYQGYSAEIQVRTIAEEAYSEFDHRIRYPYQISNKFLKRYSKIVSKGISELDDLISTCLEMDENLLDNLSQTFKDDKYVDWTKNYKQEYHDVNTEEDSDYAINEIADIKKMTSRKLMSR